MKNTSQIIPTTVAGKSYILLGLTKQKNINKWQKCRQDTSA
uniref:Uncharacterized protein n=1 Tax=Anguilla anguilla TaxID=7936 RepID=A0A0E9SV95_ANGAN